MNNTINYNWLEAEFITGDNLESLGDYVFDISNYITGDHGRKKTHKTEQELIDEQIFEINLKKPEVLFCYGHDTHRLLNNIEKINYNFKLLTHNSDIGVLPEYNNYIENEKIIKWFGQNNFLRHDKITSLPIGIARKKYQHGDVGLLSEISQQNFNKEYIVYKNFSIETNFTERLNIDNITNEKGILMSSKCTQREYLTNIAKSAFVISPPGNGIDCHRIWECLYLNTIPIVKYHHVLDQFKHLPILFINSWDEITIQNLQSKIDMLDLFKNKQDSLSFEYWKKKILNL